MREKINRLAKGTVDETGVELMIEPAVIDISSRAEEKARTDIFLNTQNNAIIKGLAYSDDPRVTITTPVFGGSRVRLVVECDCLFGTGTEITGSIDLVTNLGEYQVPFFFRSNTADTYSSLERFHSITDFVKVYGEDPDAALRIFEYKNFPSCPFMADYKMQALYKAFSGRNNRALALEEFLIACGAKAPVSISIDQDSTDFGTLSSDISGNIIIRRDSRGAADITISTESAFLGLSERHITDRDFTDDTYLYSYSVISDRLRPGDNTGTIVVRHGSQRCVYTVHAASGESLEDDMMKDRHLYVRKLTLSYLKARLEYEISDCTEAGYLDVMRETLEKLDTVSSRRELVTLLRAEILLFEDDKKGAERLVKQASAVIMNDRQELLYEYFLLEYLNVQLKRDNNRKASLIRLIRKFIEEENMNELFPFLYKLDADMKEGVRLMEYLSLLYARGVRSPYIYLPYVRFLNTHTEYLHDPGDMDLHALYFGCRYGMLSEELVSTVISRVMTLNTSHRMYYPLLMLMFRNTGDERLIGAISATLIRSGRRDRDAHSWYEAAVEQGSKVTGLYDYFLYSLPEKGAVIPDVVLDHYRDDRSPDHDGCLRLYEYIVSSEDASERYGAAYSERIRRFAYDELASGRIDGHLAVIYARVIPSSDDMERYASILPHIVCTARVEVRSDDIKAVVAVTPEIEDISVYSLTDGAAYPQMYSGDTVLLFQDAYGNRYAQADHEMKMLLDDPGIVDICFEAAEDHPIVLLRRLNAGDRKSYSQAYEKLPLSDAFKNHLFRDSATAGSEFLSGVKPENLDAFERELLCSRLINTAQYSQAYEIIKQYRITGITAENLKDLCSHMILGKMFTEDKLLLMLSRQTVAARCCDNVILDYLCEHYNGATEAMYDILKEAVRLNVETYDLEERLLAQMLFTDHKEHLDEVFGLYATRKRAVPAVVHAYFTVKSADYFLRDAATDKDVFDYIESVIHAPVDPENIPMIHQLALTKYYSGLSELTRHQTEIAEASIAYLLEKGLVFPYYKQLGRFIEMPAEVMEKYSVTYSARYQGTPELRCRVVSAESEMHKEELTRMYMNIWSFNTVLFAGESLQYEIYETTDGISTLMTSGRIRCTADMANCGVSRYDRLNALGIEAAEKNDEGLAISMRDYIVWDEAGKELFGLL